MRPMGLVICATRCPSHRPSVLAYPMENENQFRLLRKRRFGPFFLTQVLGAFNDNVYKNALVILVAYHAGSQAVIDPKLLTNLAAGIFILPFVLFSATAGQIADKFEKSAIIRII